MVPQLAGDAFSERIGVVTRLSQYVSNGAHDVRAIGMMSGKRDGGSGVIADMDTMPITFAK